MKSSFKKVEKPNQSQHASFGHPDLDAIFHNNLNRGHLLVVEEDHPTTNYLSLLRYFVSANYCEDRPTIVYDVNPGKWKYLVAPPLKKAQKKSDGEQAKQSKSEIAWRYDSMNINLSQLTIREDAIFFDLSKQVPKFNELLLCCHAYPSIPISEFYKKIQQSYLNTVQNPQSTTLIKLVLSSLPSYFYKSAELPLFLAALRAMTRSSHLLTLITVPPIIPVQAREVLVMYSDFYLQMGKIGAGYDHFCGNLTLLKEIQTGCIDIKNRGSTIWGIKNKKKQIRIQSLYEHVIGDSLADEGKGGANSIQF